MRDPGPYSMQNAGLPTYCLFDGLHWNSTRGLGRFASQLQMHFRAMHWHHLKFPSPRWRSAGGRFLLHEIVEPVWCGLLGPEVAIYPHNVLPSIALNRKTLRVLVLHDTLFLHSDKRESAGNLYRRTKLKQSLSNADLIVTVSNASRDEILTLLPGDKKILVLPNALAEAFEHVPASTARSESSGLRILHFGGHAPTKNTKAVFAAVAQIRRSGYNAHLVLAAMSGNTDLAENWRRDTELPHEALTILPPLSDSELMHQYAEAQIHCMPSTGEGFGIPVIEAARSGITNVLSPLKVFRELMGDDAIFSKSTDASSIAEALKLSLSHGTDLRQKQARARTDAFLFDSIHRQHAVPILEAIREMVEMIRSGTRQAHNA